jgi:UrcA family protein
MPDLKIDRPGPMRRPFASLLMIACATAGALSAGLAGAAPAADDVPRLVVQYTAESLRTDDGARALYRRLVKAAERVCPTSSTGYPLVRPVVTECRKQALARAVLDIHNERLAALHDASVKKG